MCAELGKVEGECRREAFNGHWKLFDVCGNEWKEKASIKMGQMN